MPSKNTKLFMLISLFIGSLMILSCQSAHDLRHAYLRDRGQDYLSSSIISPLEIPEGLSRPASSERYPVTYADNSDLAVPSVVPPGFGDI